MASVLEGLLEKRSSSIFSLKKWYMRHFALDSESLYYTNPAKPHKTAKRFLLNSIVQVKPSVKHPLEFEVLFIDRKLRLRTHSRKEKLDWMTELKPKVRFSERFPVPLMENSIRLEDFVGKLKIATSS